MTFEPTLHQGQDDRDRAQRMSVQRTRPPVEVPGYETQRFIGAGAYGEVWTAVDRKTGRRVAIKFYAHRGGLDWSLLSREVEKLCFLFADRYIVQLLDVGWDADPPYYVMEYMEAGALEDHLREGPLPVNQAVTLFREVAVGLLHAHEKGVLHCDLKPANVLLDHDGKPRLADFGQSRLSHEQTPALGTLFYMAPEQADLSAVPHARWDVYALGALLYTMLTGQPPHRNTDSETLLGESVDLEKRLARYRALIEQSPPLREHRKIPGVDRQLADIIDRCLAADPEKRYHNVQSVLDALNRRRLRRAQRPLLVLGVGAPLLLLIVMSAFAYNGFSTALTHSQQAVVDRALESNRFAAQFVAENVAGQIDHRWQILEQEAGTPRLIEQLLAARGQPRGSPEREDLQRTISAIRGRHPDIEATSWFITDDRAMQLARYPLNEKTIDENYSWRDYFHGQGQDRPKGTYDLPPIRTVHRSNVFRSEATNLRMVAFSAPIWGQVDGEDEPRVIGVLAMTSQLGTFAELRPEEGTSASQIAVLVDSHPDAEGHPGAVLEHPRLAQISRGNFGPLPEAYLSKKELDALRQLQPLRLQAIAARRDETVDASTAPAPQTEVDDPREPSAALVTPHAPDIAGGAKAETVDHAADDDLALANPVPAVPTESERQDVVADGDVESLSTRMRALALRDAYVDPVGGEYEGRWLAAIEPVMIDSRPVEFRDTGWAVIVQERYDAAARPIWALGPQLRRMGIVALAVVAALITVLWGFVIVVLNDAPQSRVVAELRRRFGLASLRGTNGTAVARSARTPEAAQQATVPYHTATPPERK